MTKIIRTFVASVLLAAVAGAAVAAIGSHAPTNQPSDTYLHPGFAASL